MSKLPLLTAKEVVKVLLKLGFVFKRQKGSHMFFEHPDGRTTVIPNHPSEQIDRGLLSKTGMMLGLGETRNEVIAVMDDLLENGCQILTLGQYLRPGAGYLEIQRYVEPQEFLELKEIGLKKGFEVVESGPFVRSSFHAAETFEKIKKLLKGGGS